MIHGDNMEEHIFPGDLGTFIKDPHPPSQVVQTPVTISLLIYVQTQRSVKEVLLHNCRLKTLFH